MVKKEKQSSLTISEYKLSETMMNLPFNQCLPLKLPETKDLDVCK
jgi:hypothetical protein